MATTRVSESVVLEHRVPEHRHAPAKLATSKPPSQPSQSVVSKLRELVSLAHLITESNIKAYALPVLLFAMLSTAARGVTTNEDPGWLELARAFPRATLYIWLYVLFFDCSNQKDPSSIEEDRANKPWRAIPSGRLSIEGAERFYWASSALLLLASGAWLGGFPEAVAFMAETWVYDSASGARNWVGKNFIGALFYMTGQIGTTRVAAESLPDTSMARAGFVWCLLLGANIFTTLQIQDLRDQEGDRLKGRSTMPLALGDGPCRWLTVFFITFWAVVCPAYWSDGALTAAYVLPLLIGGTVSARILTRKSRNADRFSFNCYSLLWLPSLYAVPLLSQYKLM